MLNVYLKISAYAFILFLITLFHTDFVNAQVHVATTTLTISICGDSLVNAGEACDIPSETGVYSTTIAGRQCNTVCQYGPYCGDGILQTSYDEECDDGNNVSLDFCSATCKAELADSGGGSSGGGGGSSSGGKDQPLGDTQVSIQGRAFPNATVTILLDGQTVGTVRTNSRGDFSFKTNADPGTATLSFFAIDNVGTRSATVNTTFDVTQGAITTVNGILIPPTIRVLNPNVNPGDIITISGQSVPNVIIEVLVDNALKKLTGISDASGNWSIAFDTKTVSVAEHTLKAHFVTSTTTPKFESIYGTALQLFVGVAGKATSNSDLNRDGKINLTDFSILIFWWSTPGGNSNPPADISKNGKVGLEDFSILLFNWTG